VKNRIQNTGQKGLSPYILLKPRKDYENVYAYYWTCSGELANGINQGSYFVSQTPGLTESGQALLLTNSVGGRDNLNDTELIETYRHALLTKDSIVTHEDILSLCAVVGGKYLANVEIDKKIVPSSLVKEGLTKVLSIKLFFKSSSDQDIVRNYVLQKLNSELEAKSNFSIPYKIEAANG